MLSEQSCNILINIVRKNLQAVLTGKRFQTIDPGLPELEQPLGCFVTYKLHGRLRGCLGCFTSEDPIWKTVARMARDSATEDHRFISERLKATEFPDITFDVSVLSPLEPCKKPESIKLGKHGIYLRKGNQSGCFLPQVADETGWTVQEFWSNCCSHKAGLSPEAWRDPEVELFTFTAQVIEARAVD